MNFTLTFRRFTLLRKNPLLPDDGTVGLRLGTAVLVTDYTKLENTNWLHICLDQPIADEVNWYVPEDSVDILDNRSSMNVGTMNTKAPDLKFPDLQGTIQVCITSHQSLLKAATDAGLDIATRKQILEREEWLISLLKQFSFIPGVNPVQPLHPIEPDFEDKP